MSDKIQDQLSALLDDELDVNECELLVSRLGRDSDLREVWERYSLIGDCIRGNLPQHISPGFAARVSASLADNQSSAAIEFGSETRKPARWQPFAGVAIAASVAMLAIVTLSDPETPVQEFDTSVSQSSADDSYTVPVINMREQASAAMRERLNLYQVSHSEVAGPFQRRAVLTQFGSDIEDPGADDISGEEAGEQE